MKQTLSRQDRPHFGLSFRLGNHGMLYEFNARVFGFTCNAGYAVVPQEFSIILLKCIKLLRGNVVQIELMDINERIN